MERQPTAYYRWRANRTVAWYCDEHRNRLTHPFWANEDKEFQVECCKCGLMIEAGE